MDFRVLRQRLKGKFLIYGCALSILSFAQICYAQENKDNQGSKDREGIIVNGDSVEYSTDAKEVSASGNVEVIHKDSRLSCDKLTVNTLTKDAQAEGRARLEDKDTVIEGKKIIYNFQTKTGTIIDAEFRSNPYFGKTRKVDKVSDTEFVCFGGYASTCSLDRPHYRIRSRRINFFPKNKIQTTGDSFYLGKIPLVYLPKYNHSFRDPLMHVQLMPGSRKGWGAYMLSAWRYNINEHANGRIYFDYRSKLGNAQGFGLNYETGNFGRGDYKFYYSHEKDTTRPQNTPDNFERYLIRWRHKWNIGSRTYLTSQYYKITDSKRALLGTEYNVLKDYFYREYEKDSQPLSYALLHHSFTNSSLDMVLQKRTNRWYEQLEKLPEINYSLPSIRIANTWFYFENSSQAANYNYKYAVPSPSADDINMIRFDTYNKLSLPSKVAFIQFTPFVAERQTYYDKDINGASTVLRNTFYSGADLSTKFYRLFNVQTNFMKLHINGLRHVITPTVGYVYNHEPTVLNSKLKQIPGGDPIGELTRNHSLALELSNKLQTKRNGKKVDVVDFRVSTTYYLKPKTGDKRGSNLSDFLFKLDLIPYSWMRFTADATYKHSVTRDSADYHRFTNVNYDFNFDLPIGLSFGVGQRYQRKGSNEITSNLKWRLSPKWKFAVYERYNIGHDPSLKRGLRELEYTISRDLHCWEVDFTYNTKKEKGNTIWLIFRLKAFPEMEFGFDQSYNQPKPGAQQ